jgi:hypothetical protein
MATPIVLFDACVLYPAPLRGLLMHLSLSGLFRARWTNEIHEEWISNLLEQRPDLNRIQLEVFLAAPDKTNAIVERLRKGLKNPPMNQAEHLNILRQQHLPKLISAISAFKA